MPARTCAPITNPPPAPPEEGSLLSGARAQFQPMKRVAADVSPLILKEITACYSENEINGNARPHPGPLPQEREKPPRCLGIFILCGAALPHEDLRQLLGVQGKR